MKNFLTVSLILVFVLMLIAGTAAAEEANSAEVFEDEYLAAPAVAGLLLEAAGVDNRYGTGRDGGNFIRDIAHKMNEDPGTDFNGVSKDDIVAYECAIAAYLNDPANGEYYPAGVECPCAGVIDPEASSSVFVDHGNGTGTLTTTLVDLCGNPILPEDFPVVPTTTTRDEDQYPESYRNYFRANADSKDNDYFYYIGASHFPDSEGFTRAKHEGFGVYTHTITKLCGHQDTWEIGIGPWLYRDDVYIIESEVQITIKPIQVCLQSVVCEISDDFFGDAIDDTIKFTFSGNIRKTSDIEVYFKNVQEFKETWGKAEYSVEGSVLTVTVTEVWNNPRPEIGDYVTSFSGLEAEDDSLPLIVPNGGVEVTQ